MPHMYGTASPRIGKNTGGIISDMQERRYGRSKRTKDFKKRIPQMRNRLINRQAMAARKSRLAGRNAELPGTTPVKAFKARAAANLPRRMDSARPASVAARKQRMANYPKSQPLTPMTRPLDNLVVNRRMGSVQNRRY